jgi:hypothetical protein
MLHVVIVPRARATVRPAVVILAAARAEVVVVIPAAVRVEAAVREVVEAEVTLADTDANQRYLVS